MSEPQKRTVRIDPDLIPNTDKVIAIIDSSPSGFGEVLNALEAALEERLEQDEKFRPLVIKLQQLKLETMKVLSDRD